jgi:alkanesulfonate monooxygenase SsuD/methylene tetrahydromethanopterin reductase-like flavin-dependent oxidoreductase (luciferase family)
MAAKADILTLAAMAPVTKRILLGTNVLSRPSESTSTIAASSAMRTPE